MSIVHERLALSVIVAAGTLTAYYFWFGRSNLDRRRKLERQLEQVIGVVA